ncbi:TonB-dependent receptor [Aquabacterium sp.]|uniref:TonB-dependent receptor domain-containing protein n=1 Tax=Aquabacterium sp. TaxID=1872578 RepID=UPI0025C6F979|nr:TonB-dependent receptor [Aquabacterium sp.]
MSPLNSVRSAPGLRSACAVAATLAFSLPVKGVAAEAVVVTATRLAQPATQVLADVFTIDRDTIDRQVGGSVSEVLRRVPGIELTQNGGSASTTSIYLRGAEKRHVLVLIDGVPFDSQSTGGATWEALPLQAVDHIEVLSGPASAAYGSDAVAGVIQIFTRKGEGAPRLAWGVGIGDQGYLSTDLSALGAIGALDYSVAVQTAQSEGFNARTNASATSYAADRDGYRSHSSQLRLGYRLSPGQRLQLGLVSQHLNAGYDASTKSKVDDRSIKDMSSANASWSAQWLPQWQSVLTLGQATDHYETRPSVYQTDTRVQTASLLNRLVLGEHTLHATLERREDHLVNSSLVASTTRGKGDRADNGLGLRYGWQHEALTFSSSLRRDQDSEFGDHVTGAVAGGYDLSDAWRVRASWGTAYKAPTLFQRFSEYGNPGLQAEHSRTRELGLQFHEGALQAGLTAYQTRVDNLINYAQPGVCVSTLGCYRNTARAQLKGLEATVATTLVGVRLSGSLDVGSPKDLDTDRQLARRARRHASVRAETDLANWQVGVQGQTYGKRFDSSSGSTVLPGYSVWGLDASRDLSASWKLLARVENVFDKAYQTASTYASSPRAFYLAVRWTPAQ